MMTRPSTASPRHRVHLSLLAVALFGLVVQARAANSAFTVKETPAAIVLATTDYEAAFNRDGAALTLRRGGETVLDGWAASGEGGAFTQGGKPRRIGRLRTMSRQAKPGPASASSSKKRTVTWSPGPSGRSSRRTKESFAPAS